MTGLPEAPAGRRGWAVVAGSFVAHFFGLGSFYAFGVFFRPIADEFAQGEGATAGAVAIGQFVSLIANLPGGRLADRFGHRRIIFIGGIALGLGLILMAEAGAIWHVYLAYGVLLGIGAGFVIMPALGAVGQWFDRRRGFAMGVALSGSGMGALVLAPLSQWLIDAYGWRTASRIVGLAAILMLSAASTLIRGRRREAHRGKAPWMFRDRAFRRLYLSFTLSSFGYLTPFIFLAPYAIEQGHTAAFASLLLAAAGIGSTLGRAALGAVADRVGRMKMMVATLAGMAVTHAVWAIGGGWVTILFIAAVLYGVFAGVFVTLPAAVLGDAYGTDHLAGLTGQLYTSAALGALLGPPVVGVLFEATGSYVLPVLLSGLFQVGGWIVLLGFRMPTRRGLDQSV